MRACINVYETPLRYLNDGCPRLNRLELSHPRENAYSPRWPNWLIIIIILLIIIIIYIMYFETTHGGYS
jgi:hypothetical protein